VKKKRGRPRKIPLDKAKERSDESDSGEEQSTISMSVDTEVIMSDGSFLPQNLGQH
jgi:hypothetical protein